MTPKPRSKPSWLTLLLIAAAIAVWGYNQFYPSSAKTKPSSRSSTSAQPSSSRRSPDKPPTSQNSATQKIGGYEVYPNCTLAEARNNDGDSFMVRLPDGNPVELRLYFVDTPESAFKTYSGGASNHERIRQQAAEMGGITPEQAVEVGKQSKTFTLGLLASQPFTIYTQWDSPFQDNRFHAFVQVQSGGKKRWLSELLVERGLARIKTKPADLPDGTPAATQKQHLQQLERTAKSNQLGVWKL